MARRVMICKKCKRKGMHKVIGRGMSFKDSNIWKCRYCGHSEIGAWGKKSPYK
jgi:ribosomal protein L37AE/L43A